MGMMSFWFMLLIGAGGASGNDLLDFVRTKSYWELKGIEITESNMLREIVSGKSGEDIGGLVRQLGAESFEERESAVDRLRKAGAAAIPRLKEAAQSEDVEIAVRARKLLAELPATDGERDIRRLMAIRALGEMRANGAIAGLKLLTEDKDFFVADYARAAVAAIEGKSYGRPVPNKADLNADLRRLPGDSGAVARLSFRNGGPMDYEALESDIGLMFGGMREGMGDFTDEMTRHAVKVAEQIGNARIEACTLAVDAEVGDDKGFAVVLLRGRYNAGNLRKWLGQFGWREEKRAGIGIFRPEDEFAFAPVDDTTLFIVAGPNEQEMPLDEVAQGYVGQTAMKLRRNITELLVLADDDADLWAVSALSDTYRRAGLLSPFGTVVFSASGNGAALQLKAVAEGEKPEEIGKVVKTMRDGIKEALTEFDKMKANGGMPPRMMKPYESIGKFLESVKFDHQATRLTATAVLDAKASPMLFMPSMLFFRAGNAARIHEPVGIDPVPEPTDELELE